MNEKFQRKHQIPDLWERLPCNIDAVFKADDGFTYFFFNLSKSMNNYKEVDLRLALIVVKQHEAKQ